MSTLSTYTIIIVSLFLALSNVFLAYSQEPDRERFIPIAAKEIEEGKFYFPPGDNIRKDVAFLSKPQGQYERVFFGEDSYICDGVGNFLKHILKDQYIPDKEFIKRNAFFYTISPGEHFADTPWSNGYDVAYVAYKVDDIEILVALTLDQGFGGTYIFSKDEFSTDTYRYNQFRELPFEALFQYYFYLKHDDDRDNFISDYQPVWRNEITTPAEAEALRKLLQSDDKQVKEYGMRLMEATRARSLLSELLAMCSDKEQIPNLYMDWVAPSDSGVSQKPRTYHYNVYRLLGKFGDKTVLQALEEMQSNQTLSPEVKADVEFAIEEIRKNIAEQERREADPKYMHPPSSPTFEIVSEPESEREPFEITPVRFSPARISGIIISVILIIIGIVLHIRGKRKGINRSRWRSER